MENIVENFYKKIDVMKENYSTEFLREKLEGYYENFKIKELDTMYDFSTYLEKFLAKVDLKNRDNVVLIKSMTKMYVNDKYLNSMAKDCYDSILDFKKFLLDNGMYEKFLIKEFSVSFYIILLFMPLAQINNLKLFETIQKLWLVVDNIVDNNIMNKKYKKLLKPLITFLNDEIYLEENPHIFIRKHKDNICMKLVQEVYDNKKLFKKRAFFKDARNLFMYSYSKEGIQYELNQDTDKILKMSIHKAYLSLTLFKNCFEDFEIDDKIYNLCFIAQLSDDLQDLEEDIINNGNTIFTRESRLNRSIITLCLLDFIIENYEGTQYKYYFSIPIIDSIIYNHYLLDKDFVDQLTDYGFINMEKCDLKRMEKLFFRQIVDKFLDRDLSDIYNIDIEKLENKEIIKRMKQYNIENSEIITHSKRSDSYSASVV